MIKYTQVETQIFRILMEFLKVKKLDLTLRVAGGWVRDKLLGFDSHDIDIALDKMMGQQFINLFHEFLL
ncbi:MAG: hypothetical protein GY823_04175 [Flavobacteriaceae bacterium]|nr:hypothetical protein [Flavobacteriaceae bacterium]